MDTRQADLPLSLALIVENLPGVITLARAADPDRVLYVSREVEALFRVNRDQWREDLNLRLRLLYPEDAGRVLHEELAARTHTGPSRSEYRIVRTDGSLVWVHHETRPIIDPASGETFLLGWISDISSRKKTEEMLQDLAFVDDLTGLYNRRGFYHLASRHLQLSQRTRRSSILIVVDVDWLKAINDTWGHAEGDRALTAVAGLLRSSFRTTDILGRLSGDEFAALAIEADQDRRPELLQRLERNLEVLNHARESLYSLSFSVGTCYYLPENPRPLEDLLKDADAELYQHKAIRRPAPSVFAQLEPV